MPLTLTERDYQLFHTLYEYRYLSIEQLQRLHFCSLQTAMRRVRLLSNAGFIMSFSPIGVDQRLVALSTGGASIVAESNGLSVSDLSWSRKRSLPKDYYFLRHFLLINDIRIALQSSCTAHQKLDLLGFIPEYHYYSDHGPGPKKHIREMLKDVHNPSQAIVHTPDGVFAVQHDGKPALFFVEADRGTESLSDVRKGFLKIVRFYLSYLLSGHYQRYRTEFGLTDDFSAFRVLFVTTSQKRLENMRKIAAGYSFHPPHAKRFIWLSHVDALQGDSFLHMPWVSLAQDDDSKYSILKEGS